jgi:hypothetical protein
MGKLNNHQYYFGMWLECMAQDLAWSVPTNRANVRPREPLPIVPSWSWASVTGIVEYSKVEKNLVVDQIKTTAAENSAVMGYKRDDELTFLRVTGQVVQTTESFHIRYEIEEGAAPRDVMLNFAVDEDESGEEVASSSDPPVGEDGIDLDYAFADESVGRSSLMVAYRGWPRGRSTANDKYKVSKTLTQTFQVGGLAPVMRRNMRQRLWEQYKLPYNLRVCLVADIEGNHEMDMLTRAWRPDYAFWNSDEHHIPSWTGVKLLFVSKCFYIVLVETDIVLEDIPVYRSIGAIVFEPHHALGVILPKERVEETLFIV